jgi:hypothetical protein
MHLQSDIKSCTLARSILVVVFSGEHFRAPHVIGDLDSNPTYC